MNIEQPTSNIQHRTSNIERCSVEERESALRAQLRAVRIWNSRLSRYSRIKSGTSEGPDIEREQLQPKASLGAKRASNRAWSDLSCGPCIC
ncbi:MAG: hypothetical protein DME23_04755 [Verrucomicrobia bacterium]|nr:MAG: hypothetical protein DME23_04755 [Verrucomicrobiota bacterium]